MKKSLKIAEAAIIAALYVVLTWVSSVLGLSTGVVQCRFSEALCILPIFTPAAIPGLTIGCFISNLITSANIFDIVIGSTATFIGVCGAYMLRNCPVKVLATVPTVLSNALLVPVALRLMDIIPSELYLYTAFTVAVGEVISCTLLGMLLFGAIKKSKLDRYLGK